MSRQESVPAPVASRGVTTVRSARLLAWLPLGLYGVLTVVGLVLQGLAGIAEDPTIGWSSVALESAAILVWSAVGSLLATRRPSNPIGWLLGATALVWAISQCCFGYGAWGLVAHPGSLPAATLLVVLLHRPMEPLLLLGAAMVFLLFPDGRLPSERWRPVALAGVAAAAVEVLGWIVDPRTITIGDLGIRSPLQVGPALHSLLTPLFVVAFLGLFVVLLAAVASLWLRLRRARGQARQQLKWFAYATAFLPVGFGALFFGPNATTDRIGAVLVVVASAGMPLAVAVAIFRYRLYDIDRIINRTVVYGLLTAILGLGYTGGVLLLGQALGRGRSSLAVAVMTLATAAVFQPARRQVQGTVDRRFNRRRYDAAKTIEAFSVRLRQQVDLDVLTAELLAVVNQTMEPMSVSLWLRPPYQRR